jgi:hypothetical protein
LVTDEAPAVVAAIEEPEVTPAVAVPDPEVPPAAGPSFGEVSEFVANYQGSSACFAAVPSELANGTVAVTAYADDRNASEALADTVAQRFGSAVAIDAQALAPAQCGALSFLGNVGGVSRQVNLSLANQAITDGNFLQGTIRNAGGNVYLLVVDDEGMVSVADSALTPDGENLTFQVQVHLTGSGANSAQLLIAIVSNQMLEAPELLDGRQAGEFFEKLGQEAAMGQLIGGLETQVAITSFVVVD